MRKMRNLREAVVARRGPGALALLVGALLLALGTAQAAAKPAAKPRYYFAVGEVKSEVPLDEELRAAARDVLIKDLSARPEFTQDLGGATPETLPEELRRRKLKGFNVTLKITAHDREPKPPKPGGRLKQLAVGVKVSVFGTTIPEAKLAFGGDGEATVEAEIIERRQAEEAAALSRDALVQAVKQAVDQAVGKLGETPSKPYNESKRRKPAK
jgi:hypothetical protein